MPQTLYTFGIDPSDPAAKAVTAKAIDTSDEIDILWSSWCDLIYTTTNTSKTRSITYIGTSLSPAQQQEFTCPDSNINHALANPECNLSFFGSTMHDGVRGYIWGDAIRVFNTPAEEAEFKHSYHDIQTLDIPSSVVKIAMCSNSSFLLSLKAVSNRPDDISSVIELGCLRNRSETSNCIECLAEFTPTQLVVNATTATALSPSGQVYTRTADSRYPACLGRPYTGTSIFEPVPYLSETRITNIASGGYMTAAISEDGELFLWGQSNPGTEGELGVLHRLDYDADAVVEKETVLWVDTVQGEDTKCLNIHIDGRDATAYDVAVGNGHILVAAKDDTGKHVVFAAGCGAEGQLGIGRAVDFKAEYEEVVALKGSRVTQLAAAGWSSFVVTED